tara:strand:+ start:129 stop:650 length:522 start_codon:yes stop_codon:yes gene_type:complete
MLDHQNNFFPEVISHRISEYAHYHAQYRYGERDNPYAPPVGLVAELFHMDKGVRGEDERIVYDYFIKYVNEKYDGFWDTYTLQRLYINCFAPREFANFHQDLGVWTFLYYPIHNFDYDKNQGGCTEFFVDEQVIGIPPTYNSIVRFSAPMEHRATPFKDHHRFTIALKCIKNE